MQQVVVSLLLVIIMLVRLQRRLRVLQIALLARVLAVVQFVRLTTILVEGHARQFVVVMCQTAQFANVTLLIPL